jgi:hypothetical protein
MRSVLLSVIATAGLVGCVGGIDMPTNEPPPSVGSGTNPSPVPPAQSVAKQMFDQNVFPIISADQAAGTSGCAGTNACHSTAGATPTMFVAANSTDGYATVTSFQSVVGNFTPSAAGILTKIGAGGLHNGRTYSTTEMKAINDWLAQEVTERAGGGGGGSGSGGESPGAATARLLNQWSACMTEANWTTAKMTQAWGQMQTNNGSRCESCHATGGQGFIATEIQDTTTGSGPGMWTVVSSNQYYMVQFFTVDLTATPAKVMINHVSFDGVSTGTPPHTEHPQFNATNNNGMTALQSFYDLTTAAVTAGNCGAPKLNPPAQ